MIDKLEKDLTDARKEIQIPAIASAIMHSEFYKSKVKSQNSGDADGLSTWVERGSV